MIVNKIREKNKISILNLILIGIIDMVFVGTLVFVGIAAYESNKNIKQTSSSEAFESNSIEKNNKESKVIRPFCIAEHLDYKELSKEDRTKRIDLLKASGTSWVRFDFEALRFYKENGEVDFSYFDPIVWELKEKNLGIVAVLPQWGEEGGSNYKSVIETPERYGQYAGFLAKYLKSSGIDFMIEAGNEPNDEGFWPGRSPEVYTTYLIEAYDAIKNVDPDIHVISGGVVMYFNDFRNIKFNALNWLKRLYEAGIKREDSNHKGQNLLHFDSYAIHLYIGNNNPERYYKILRDIKDFIKSQGDQAEIAITEIGWSTGNDGDRENVTSIVQADKIKNVYREIATHQVLKPLVVCYYNLVNKGESSEMEDNYGLVNFNHSPKPSFNVFQEITAE